MAYKEKTGRWPEHWEKRREYCTLTCMRQAEAGHFEPLPHHPGCITVMKFKSGEFVPTVMCCEGCKLKDGPVRYVRIAKARPNAQRKKRRDCPVAQW